MFREYTITISGPGPTAALAHYVIAGLQGILGKDDLPLVVEAHQASVVVNTVLGALKVSRVAITRRDRTEKVVAARFCVCVFLYHLCKMSNTEIYEYLRLHEKNTAGVVHARNSIREALLQPKKSRCQELLASSMHTAGTALGLTSSQILEIGTRAPNYERRGETLPTDKRNRDVFVF